MTPRRIARVALLGIALLNAPGCNPVYLAQAVQGQLDVVRARRPVAEVIADPATAPALRDRLVAAEAALDFAHAALALPDNGSYRQFAELRRPFVVWNVFSAPELSLRLRRWCFPVAGCVAYRGYFAEDDARRFAEREVRHGQDVAVVGAAAYSTLGFFRDPLLSSVTRLPATAQAGLIFHELAHQRLYVPGDTAFNESFATLVEQEGTVRWLTARGDHAGLCSYLRGLERERQVHQLIREARARLAAAYAADAPDESIRSAKAAEFARLRERYRRLRASWREPPWFDGWFDDSLNNARLGALAAYQDHVGRLRVILESEGGSLPIFYARAQRLARLDNVERAAVLRQITTPSDRRPGAACRDGSG